MTDHPRSRGVYGRHGRRRRETGGSSPLARGLHRRRGPGRRLHRIIPARAGFTLSRRNSHRSPLDHPRSRGVYAPASTGRVMTLGSSPLARGLQHIASLYHYPRGIIPARAGFTARGARPPTGTPDHPRSRGVYVGPGEHDGVVVGIIPARAGFTRRADHPRRAPHGSSPLARGLPRERARKRQEWRIIPARAGFTE